MRLLTKKTFLFSKTFLIPLVFAFLLFFPPGASGVDYYSISCPNYVVTSSKVDIIIQKTMDGTPTCDASLQLEVFPPSATPTVYVNPTCTNAGLNVFSIDSSQNGRYQASVLSAGVSLASCSFSTAHKPGFQVPDSNFLTTALIALVAFLLFTRACRGQCNQRKRGQLTIEFFFALTLFALLLPWLSYYAGSTKSSAVAANAFLQQELLARDLVKAINQACVSNTSISFELPCVRVGETNLNYSIFSSGSVVFVRGEAPFQQTVSKNASCELEYFLLTPECSRESGNAGSVCINVSSGKPVVTSNACLT